MTRRLHAFQFWGLLVLLTTAFQAVAADGLTPFDAEPTTASGEEELPLLLNPPNDTTVADICSIPARDTLLFVNPNDMTDSLRIFPIDSTASNGLVGTVDPCVQDTLFRIWRGTFMDMTTAEAIQQIIVEKDETPPMSDFPINLDTIVDCEIGEPTFDSWRQTRLLAVNTNASDCSGILSLNNDMPSASYVPAPCDTLVVSFVIEDVCNNVQTYEASFITVDTVAPVLQNVPDTIKVSCDTVQDYLMNNPPSMVTATDNCRSSLEVGFQQDTIPGPQFCSEHDLDIRRSWFVTDSCGNFTSAVQIINVRDESGPTFTRPPDITISCDADPLDLSITGTVTDTMDACGDPVTVSFSDEIQAGSCDNNYFIERQWVVTDICGISSSINQLIIVKDTIAPTFTVPPDTTVNCGDENNLAITGEPTQVMDNCSGADSLQVEILSETVIAGSCENDYIIERAWRVADECGNDSVQVQQVTVIDTVAPIYLVMPADLTLTCGQGTDITAAYTDWVTAYGGAEAGDACTPQDSLTWSAFIAGTNQPAFDVPLFSCPAGSDTLIHQTVDFIVDDNCGNARLAQATFLVIDQEPPSIVSCPPDQIISTNFGQCSANFTLEVPAIQETCATSGTSVNLVDNAVITSDAGPGQATSTPVNIVELSFPVGTPLPINAQGAGQLSLQLNNADAEGVTEYFTVVGEDGTPIGRTGRALVQCGNSDTLLTVPKPLLDLWAVDGVITIRLEPNIPTTQPGSFAINAICDPPGTVSAALSFEVADLQGLQYEYKTNNNPRVLVDPVAPVMVTLPIGQNTITYYVTDCAGNVDSCIQQVRVEDQEPPQLTCPADIAVPLEPGNCSAMVTLPLPDNITDNCGLEAPYIQRVPADTATAWLTYTFDPNLNDYIANSKTYTFNGVAANAVTNVNLVIDLRGDFNSSGAFFNILGDNGDTLSATPVGVAGCGAPGQFAVSIPAVDFNEWASDGTVAFTLEPNFIPVPPGGPGDGINPCAPGVVDADGEVDSLSYAFVTLTYQQVTPFYYAEGATDIPYTQMTVPALSPTHEFNVGQTTVYYIAQDAVGNPDTCSYTVDILDNEPPVALCNATFVDINPSGLEPDTVSVEQFDAGSFDNCAIDTMFLSPNTFTCNEAGTTVMATLTVIDEVGNASTCTRPIRIEAEAPEPAYSSGICGGDTLYLFANPPEAEGGTIYTYTWTGPNGNIVSTHEDPILPNVDEDDAGAYVLTIEGLSGCVAQEVVNVNIIDQPLTSTVVANAQQCGDEDIVLNSSIVLNNATYYWYEGQAPNGDLITTTNQATVTLPPSNPAQPTSRFFYLIIEANGCFSDPSPATAVLLTPRPNAIVDASSLTRCEGESFSLGTPVSGQGISHQWTGPDGFSSTAQYPATIGPAELENAGVYNLTVIRNGCASDPALTVVNILPKPGPFNIAVKTNPFCEGDKITLQAEPSGAASYTWTGPELNTITTSGNTLILDDANLTYHGNWTVQGTQFSCTSDVSLPANVTVNERPNAMASTNLPPEGVLCERSALELNGSPILPGATYTWSGPNGYMSVAQSPVLNQVTAERTGTYTFAVTSQAGCSDTTSIDVEVVEAVDIIGVSNDAEECLYAETDVVLQSTVFPADDGSYDYLWTGPGYTSSDEIAIVENVTGAQNGFTYTLTVFTEEGCPSLPASTTLQVKNAPARLPSPTTSNSDYEFCVDESLTLNTPFVSNASYVWITPAGAQNTGPDPSLTVNGLTVNDAGSYQVYVIVNGCASIPSPVRMVEVNPKPTVQASSNSPVCEGTPLQLFADGTAGSTYSWTGPFSSSDIQNPVIATADPGLHNGVYKVVASKNGCTSDTATVQVIVNETLPAPAMLNSNAPICIDEPGATLTVSVENGQSGSDIRYLWYSNGNPVDTTLTPNLLLNDFSGMGGLLELDVEVQTGDCISDPSPTLLVELDTIPDELAIAGMDTSICAGDELVISATPVQAGMGAWSEINSNGNAVIIENPDSPTTIVSGFEGAGERLLVWSLSNGGCEAFSSDTLSVEVGAPELADAGTDTLLCPGDPIVLDASEPEEGAGYWSQSAVQEDFNVFIDDMEDPGTTISGPGLLPGNTYVFTWTVDSECGADSAEVFVALADNNPFAGFDLIVCEEEARADLMAEIPADGSAGRWSAPADDQLVFSNRNNPITTVANLAEGENLAVWTLDEGLCGEASRDTVVIDYQLPPDARDDERTVAFAVETLIDPLMNDEAPEGSFVDIVVEPMNGRAVVQEDNRIAYTPAPDFAGTDELIYQLCREGCVCDEARLLITVGEGLDCEVPNVITPNGDGVNDAFIIPCLLNTNRFPNSQLSVFNRWGDEVYRSPVPYLNNWSGTFNGEDLPADTYFYILDFGEGSPNQTGYIHIQK